MQPYNYSVGLRPIAKKCALAALLLISAQLALALSFPRSFWLTEFGDLTQCMLLIAAFVVIHSNATVASGRAKPFWALMTLGFGMWLCAQLLWTYFEVFLRREVPNPFVGDIVLFLHIVPMMAALAVQPQAHRDDHLTRFNSLDFLLLLIWWLYLFLFHRHPLALCVSKRSNVWPLLRRFVLFGTPGFPLRFGILVAR